MPLQPYNRDGKWWAKGKVELDGQAITGYYRCSTKVLSEQAAWQWCANESERQQRLHILGPEAGDEEGPLTFSSAVMLYEMNPKTAGYLLPIVDKIGETEISKITPKMVRELAREMYPDDGVAT